MFQTKWRGNHVLQTKWRENHVFGTQLTMTPRNSAAELFPVPLYSVGAVGPGGGQEEDGSVL